MGTHRPIVIISWICAWVKGVTDRATAHVLCRVLDEGWAQTRTRYVGAPAEKAGRCNDTDGILTYDRAGKRDPEALSLRSHTRLGAARLPCCAPQKGAA